MSFSATVLAHLRGEQVRPRLCFELDFRSGILRAWQGIGDLAIAGKTWSGSGHFVSASGLDLSPGAFARSFTITLSGLAPDQFAAYGRLMGSDPAEYRGRRASVFLVFLGDDQQPLEAPYAISTGFMDRPVLSVVNGQHQLSLQCEGAFVTRKRPRYGFYTDQDQQSRFPGDRSFEFAPISAQKNVRQPVL